MNSYISQIIRSLAMPKLKNALNFSLLSSITNLVLYSHLIGQIEKGREYGMQPHKLRVKVPNCNFFRKFGYVECSVD